MRLVVGVAMVMGGRVLAARRAHPPELAGRWELPGGKAAPGEDPSAAAVREIAEELGCEIEVTGWLAPEAEIRPGLVLRVAIAHVVGGEPVPTEHDIVRWLDADQLDPGHRDAVDWLPADVAFLQPLQVQLRSEAGSVGTPE